MVLLRCLFFHPPDTEPIFPLCHQERRFLSEPPVAVRKAVAHPAEMRLILVFDLDLLAFDLGHAEDVDIIHGFHRNFQMEGMRPVNADAEHLLQPVSFIVYRQHLLSADRKVYFGSHGVHQGMDRTVDVQDALPVIHERNICRQIGNGVHQHPAAGIVYLSAEILLPERVVLSVFHDLEDPFEGISGHTFRNPAGIQDHVIVKQADHFAHHFQHMLFLSFGNHMLVPVVQVRREPFLHGEHGMVLDIERNLSLLLLYFRKIRNPEIRIGLCIEIRFIDSMEIQEIPLPLPDAVIIPAADKCDRLFLREQIQEESAFRIQPEFGIDGRIF